MIAVCITGQYRTWDRVKDNILQNIIRDNTDVFFVCDEDLSIPNISHEIVKEHQSFYDTSVLQSFCSRTRPEVVVENCINMFYKVKRCNDLKKQYENIHNFKYDIVVRLRTDTPFRSPLSFSEDKDKIFIPANLDYGGVCDQFAYGCSELMDKFCDLFTNIKQYFDEGCLFHPETIVKYHCDKVGLDIVRQDVGMLSIVR
jgi:hypothetical protein